MQADRPIPLTTSGWRRGFSSLWRKEMGEWWRTRTWLVHLLVWPLGINGLIALVSYASQFDPTQTHSILNLQVELLLNLGTVASGVGAIVLMQSAIIGERQSGTAAWILSKPTSRVSFIIAKFGANALNLMALSVLLPCAIAYVEARLFGEVMPTGAYLGLVAILLVHALFYQAFALMLGTFFQKRGAVLGTSLGVLFGGAIIKGFFPQLQWVTPFGLQSVGAGLFGFAPLPENHLLPLLATVAWTIAFLVIAVRRFNQEEL